MLSRNHRFHGLNALSFAHKQGKVVRGTAINLRYVLNTRRQTYRVAVVVSKKVSKSAVVRNRIRRRVFESVRLQADAIQQPYDLIFMVYSAELATMDADTIKQQISHHLHTAGVI